MRTMTIDDYIRTLERFNEKVDRLGQRGFTEESRGGGAIVRWEKGRGWDGIHVGPSEKTVEATILTLRFFIQNNESTALSNIAKLYADANIEAEISAHLFEIRDALNSYLDAPSNLSISEEGPMSHRDILYLFIYGDLAHANNSTIEANFRDISSTAFFPLFQEDFSQSVRVLVSALHEIQQLNVIALDRLGSGGEQP